MEDAKKMQDENKKSAVKTIIAQMRGYSQQWKTTNDQATNDALHEKAVLKAAELDQYGVHADYDNGWWTVTKDDLNPSNVSKHLYDAVYHRGGIAGDSGTLEQNEMMAKLQTGEAILDDKRQKAVMRLLDFASSAMDKMSKLFERSRLVSMIDAMRTGLDPLRGQSLDAVSGSTTSIDFGDVYIYGTNEETVEKHRAVRRDMANEVLGHLGLGRY